MSSVVLISHDRRVSVTVASLPALGPWAPPAERGPSLESIYRVSLTVDLCEGNKIISLKKLFHHSQLGTPQKEKKSGGPGHVPWCPVCALVKTALLSDPTITVTEAKRKKWGQRKNT